MKKRNINSIYYYYYYYYYYSLFLFFYYYYIIILSGLLGRTLDCSSSLSPGYHSYSFNEWRSPKTNNIQSSTAPRQRTNPLSDLGLSDDDWDRPPLTG